MPGPPANGGSRRLAGGMSSTRSVTRVILISTHDEREVADLVAASPAVGFLAKLDLNADAIHELLAGR